MVVIESLLGSYKERNEVDPAGNMVLKVNSDPWWVSSNYDFCGIKGLAFSEEHTKHQGFLRHLQKLRARELRRKGEIVITDKDGEIKEVRNSSQDLIFERARKKTSSLDCLIK
jgi:hypothetical protein